jgi:Fur family transcriptional regulator, ferric uptake regulator
MASADLHVIVGARLRSAGQRYTTGRRDVVEILVEARKPLSIPEILARSDGLAQSSVYRNLAVLEQAHVVRKVVTGEEFGHYELAEDLTEHHHHLVCSSCGTVQDVTIPSRLEKSMERALDQVAAETGFAAVTHRLDLIGTCRTCGSQMKRDLPVATVPTGAGGAVS